MNLPSRSAELYSMVGVNFSNLMHNNQIFRNDFVCNHYHLCKLSVQTIECKIFTPYNFIQLLFYTYTVYLLWSDYALRNICGTNWLNDMSLAVVSRLTQIYRSNWLARIWSWVNDPVLYNPRRLKPVFNYKFF